MSRIAVTGAEGYLGALFSRFAEKENDVKKLSYGKEFNLPHVAPKLENFDYCIHFAALTDLSAPTEKLYEINAEGTLNILENLERNSPNLKRFAYVSTGGVYGYGEKPFAETDEPHPQGDYEKSKLEGEKHAKAFSKKFPTSVIRLFYPFGKTQPKTRLVKRLAEKIAAGESVTLKKNGRPKINPVYDEDFCRLAQNILSADDPEFEVYNAAGRDAVSIKQLCELLGKLVGKKPVFEETGEETLDMVGDISKARKRFNFQPRSLEDALRETLAGGR